jgi:Xaa-Pro aminopeptidase
VKRSVLAAATAVALSAGALGVSAPAALAAPSGHGHGSSTHGHGPSQGSHQLQNAQRKVEREVSRKDHKLASLLSFHGYEVLDDDTAAAVGTNIATDQAALAALGGQVAATTTMAEVRAIGEQVHAVRPEVYYQALNGLGRVARIESKAVDVQAAIADLGAQLDALAALGVDVTVLRAALEALAPAIQAAVDAATTAATAALTLTASSTPEEIQAVRDAVAAAAAAFAAVAEQVEAFLATLPTTPTAPVTP